MLLYGQGRGSRDRPFPWQTITPMLTVVGEGRTFRAFLFFGLCLNVSVRYCAPWSHTIAVNVMPEPDGDSQSEEARLTELMQGYQRGEAASFQALYSLVSGELKRYFAYLSGDAHRAEDCLQECFMQIHRVRHTFHPARPFRPWAYAIARNVYFMDRRSSMRRQRHEYRFPESDWYMPKENNGLAHREDLDKVLAGLPLEYREALVLHHAFGFSFKEIGAMTGTRAGTAKARSFRALKQLRKELDDRNV